MPLAAAAQSSLPPCPATGGSPLCFGSAVYPERYEVRPTLAIATNSAPAGRDFSRELYGNPADAQRGAAPALPEGITAGSRPIGTDSASGKTVYQTPDGKKLIQTFREFTGELIPLEEKPATPAATAPSHFDPDAWLAKKGREAAASHFDPDAWLAKKEREAAAGVPNLEVIKGALLGAFGGLLITVFVRKSKAEQPKKEEKTMPKEENIGASKDKKHLLDRWSVKLALLGIALGIFGTLGMGYTKIGFMIGFALPMSIILGITGLIIDFFRYRKK